MKGFVFGFVCCFLIFFFPRRGQPQEAGKLKETIRQRNHVVKREGRGERLEQCPLGKASGSRASVEEVPLAARTVILRDLSGAPVSQHRVDAIVRS